MFELNFMSHVTELPTFNRHVGNSDITETCWRHVADTTQNVAVWATKSTRRLPT